VWVRYRGDLVLRVVGVIELAVVAVLVNTGVRIEHFVATRDLLDIRKRYWKEGLT